jgi:hypothetical protein
MRVLIAVVALTNSTGCATLAHGVHQEVRITSEPEGALVFVGSKSMGPTPTVVRLARLSSLAVRFEMDGFQPLTIPVKKSVSGWVAGDAVALNPYSCQGLNNASGCPGLMIANLATLFGVDFLSGAAFKFPQEVHGFLRRK